MSSTKSTSPKVKVYATANYVAPTGPKPSAIAIVGEAPGAEEDRVGRPFVGASGRLLDQMLSKVGINRATCYITNVIKTKPYGNDFQIYYEDTYRRRPIPQLLDAWDALHAELEDVNPNVIIALGAEALKALLRNPKVKIGNLRGSILQSTSGKVVATYHPAAIMRQYSWYPIALLDLKRAREESASPMLNLPKRNLLTSPTYSEVMDFIDFIESKPNPHVAFDIETIKRNVSGADDPVLRLDPRLRAPRVASFKGTTSHIDCIAIAPDADVSMSIPLAHYPSGEPYWSLADEIDIWLRLYRFFANPKINFVAQNAQYDTQVMRRYGFTIRNLWLDTMLAAHTVYPEFPKGLDFLTSIYTREPYYKDEIHSKRWEYNAKDAAVTIEIAHKLLADMKEFGVEEFYFNHVNTKLNILNDIQEQGIAVDMEMREAASKQIQEKITKLEAEIRELVGFDLNPNSPKQMVEYLYQTLKLPKQYNRKSGNLTADVTAMKKLYAKTGRKELELLLKLRENIKLKSSFIDLKFDVDGRIRCQYKLSGTETGRLSSSSTIDEVGMNLQQIPNGPAREMFIPDKGKVFVEADSSQAEARVVAWLSNEEHMIENFLSGDDIHKRNASLIFGIPYDKVSNDQRYLAKRIVHACVPGDHEVLTINGWKPISEVTTNDIVIQWHENGMLSPTHPTAIHAYDYDDELISIQGRAIDIQMTPNHRVPWRTSEINSLRVTPAMDLVKTAKIPTVGTLDAQEITQIPELPDNIIQLAVAIAADGHLQGQQIIFNLKKQRKIDRILELTKNGQKRRLVQENNGAVRIYIHLDDYPELEYIIDPYTRQFAWNIMMLNLKSKQTFINELPFWDGTTGPTGRREYLTTSRHNADVVQAVAHSAGIQCLIRRKDDRRSGRKTLWTCSFNNRVLASINNAKITRTKHVDKVYAITVPSTFFVIRHNDRVSITGNSNYGMGPRKFAEVVQMPEAKARELLNTYYSSFPRIPLWHRKIEESLRKYPVLETPWGRKRVFYGRDDNERLRAAIAYVPQSTVGDLLHRALHGIYARLPQGASVKLQIHDALLLQCLPEDVDYCRKILHEEMEQPIMINGRELCIPAESKVGKNWSEVS